MLPFPSKRKKRFKRSTKYQILSNVLPFFDDVGISRRERALRGYAESYNVEVMDTKSLNDSLFFAKKKVLMTLLETYEKKEEDLNTIY